jgi:hypothetical protein
VVQGSSTAEATTCRRAGETGEVGTLSHYVIRVVGHLSDDLLTAFPLLLAEGSRPETVLHGRLPDQSALAGVLAHLDELGIEIVDVSLVPELPPEQAAGPAGHS